MKIGRRIDRKTKKETFLKEDIVPVYRGYDIKGKFYPYNDIQTSIQGRVNNQDTLTFYFKR